MHSLNWDYREKVMEESVSVRPKNKNKIPADKGSQ